MKGISDEANTVLISGLYTGTLAELLNVVRQQSVKNELSLSLTLSAASCIFPVGYLLGLFLPVPLPYGHLLADSKIHPLQRTEAHA